ncbi:MAG TPA: hypothetical protein PKE40_11475, partial [Arachnia sp.]|nr:hypothetical protein [Arachnia sp.]HMT86964.1 hypothetical protein [Arachnia sp.]
GGGYAGAASLAAYGVLVDANSRPPKWFGPASLLFLVIADFTLNDVKTALASTIYLTVLSLFGQFIRVAFAGGRAQREASELSRRLEHMRLTQAVHDSAAARLGQVLLVARSLQSDEELTPRLRREVDILVDVAAAGASELRDALRQEPALPTSVSTLEQEWIRSLQVLRTSGFIVAESASPMTSSVPVVIQREMVRCLREATTNIGRHGKPGGRVAVLLTLDDRYLRLTCSNDTDDETPTLPDDRRRLGLLGMQQRVGAMGGAVEASADNGVFSLSVAFPLSPSADHSVTAHAKESIYAERSRGLP